MPLIKCSLTCELMNVKLVIILLFSILWNFNNNMAFVLFRKSIYSFIIFSFLSASFAIIILTQIFDALLCNSLKSTICSCGI